MAGDVKLLRHKISRNLSTEVMDMKLETKDGWFKRRVGEERKTKGGGIGSVHNNNKKNPSTVSFSTNISMCPFAPYVDGLVTLRKGRRFLF